MKIQENNQRFLSAQTLLLIDNSVQILPPGAMAEGGKADMIIGLFSTTREFDVNGCNFAGRQCHMSLWSFLAASDHEANTALHKAAKNGHLLVCHILTRVSSLAFLFLVARTVCLDLSTERG